MYIRINWKIYCVVSGLYINEILFLQLIGLHFMVIEVCLDVVWCCIFCGKCMRGYCIVLYCILLIFSEQSVEYNPCY
jgi:hypothetical protein